MPARPPFGSLLDTVRDKTSPGPTTSAANASSVGNSQKDRGDMAQPPATVFLNAERAPPAYDLSGLRREPGRTEESLTRSAPIPGDKLHRGREDVTANSPINDGQDMALILVADIVFLLRRTMRAPEDALPRLPHPGRNVGRGKGNAGKGFF